MIVYQNNETKGFYYYNGSSWVLLSNANYGDIKTGIQTTDHNGWVKLDGRAKTSLTSTQQIQATSLGIGTNLPDASGAYLVQNGQALGGVTGSNTTNLTQANLPNVSFTGTAATDGSHNHSGSTSTDGLHNHGLPVAFTGTAAGWNISPWGANGFTFAGSALTTNSGSHSHSLTINSSGSHSHNVSVSSGGSNAPINIAPRSLSVNTFIYLGL
jgi:hypothetical protein